MGSNCAETVQKALEGAGLDAGRLNPLIKAVVSFPMTNSIGAIYLEKTPNKIYDRIIRNNEGTILKPSK